MVAVPEGVIIPLDNGYIRFPKIKETHKIPDARSLRGSQFYTEDTQLLAPSFKIHLQR